MPNDHIGKGDEYVSVEASASADTPLTSPNTDEEIERAAGQFHQRRSCRVIVDSSSDFAPAVLKRLGLDRDWLAQELRRKGAETPKDVYLMTVNHGGQSYLAKKERKT